MTKVLGLIPTRLGSTRLPFKPLLEINNIPLIIHTYKRALISKSLDDLYICCDDIKIANVAKKFKAKYIMTSKNHNNGTERITEAYIKLKSHKFDFVLDIQGDEPLVSPLHIKKIIDFHKKNKNADIILPTLKIRSADNTNLIKIVKNNKDEVMYLSRAKIPLEFKSRTKFFLKHLSIISFKPTALIKFSKSKKTYLEKIEDIELLRALEIGLKIKNINMIGDSFSVDVHEDYVNAIEKFKTDKYLKRYK
jgi:3-deoxy-manno-octulosonate cytidylyltransferase (CMP-KDO synthetase)